MCYLLPTGKPSPAGPPKEDARMRVSNPPSNPLAIQSLAVRDIAGKTSPRVCRNLKTGARNVLIELAPKGSDAQITGVRTFAQTQSADLPDDAHVVLDVRAFVGGRPTNLEIDLKRV